MGKMRKALRSTPFASPSSGDGGSPLLGRDASALWGKTATPHAAPPFASPFARPLRPAVLQVVLICSPPQGDQCLPIYGCRPPWIAFHRACVPEQRHFVVVANEEANGCDGTASSFSLSFSPPSGSEGGCLLAAWCSGVFWVGYGLNFCLAALHWRPPRSGEPPSPMWMKGKMRKALRSTPFSSPSSGILT